MSGGIAYVLDKTGDDTMRFRRKTLDEIDLPSSGLVIVDESSMVGREICTDILTVARSLDLSVLFVGDGKSNSVFGVSA